jgi:hypothetical protein
MEHNLIELWEQGKPLTEQTDGVQNMVSEIMMGEPDSISDEPAGIYPRITQKKWLIEGGELQENYSYLHPANHSQNGLINTISYAVVST